MDLDSNNNMETKQTYHDFTTPIDVKTVNI